MSRRTPKNVSAKHWATADCSDRRKSRLSIEEQRKADALKKLRLANRKVEELSWNLALALAFAARGLEVGESANVSMKSFLFWLERWEAIHEHIEANGWEVQS